VHVEIHRQVFDQNEPRPPAGEIESFERLYLVAFDVDREKIDRCRRAGVDENFIDCLDRDFDAAFGARGRNIEVGIEGGMDAGEMERQGAAGLAR